MHDLTNSADFDWRAWIAGHRHRAEIIGDGVSGFYGIFLDTFDPNWRTNRCHFIEVVRMQEAREVDAVRTLPARTRASRLTACSGTRSAQTLPCLRIFRWPAARAATPGDATSQRQEPVRTLQAEHIKQHSHYDFHKLAERAFARPDEPLRLAGQGSQEDRRGAAGGLASGVAGRPLWEFVAGGGRA
jgi:hypothetical protein